MKVDRDKFETVVTKLLKTPPIKREDAKIGAKPKPASRPAK